MNREHPARPGSPWRPVAGATATAVGAVGALAAPRLGVPAIAAAGVAGGAALLAVLALPSLSTRRVTVLVLGVAALGALRHAARPEADSTTLVVWAAASLLALLLVDRAGAEAWPALPGGRAFAPRLPEAVRNGVIVAAVAMLAAVLVVPSVTHGLAGHVLSGAVPTFGDAFDAPASLRATNELDMTSRPRLSDQVVFTVDAPRPDFWRGETFDRWDGRTWTRSDTARVALARSGASAYARVDPHDTGARAGTDMVQTFRVETGFSEVVFAAPSLVEVRSDRTVVGRGDGSAAVLGGLGRGAVYTVRSRSALPTEQDLRRATGPVPDEVRDRFAAAPVATDRVRALSVAITAGLPGTYDRIRAIERWLGEHTRYSLDAPLSPAGVDVVDHFLFESRLGWCEQVASSLVVLARSAGIPARLATGFVPGTRDGLTGRFVVRERDAHAWAEVWFPGIGWQGFDPTASVPLSGEAPTGASWIARARANVPELTLALLAIAGGALVAPDLVAGARRRVRRGRSWPARTAARLERLGRRAGCPRAAAETPVEYSRALAARLATPSLVHVGEALDRECFAPADARRPARRARAEAALDEASARASG